MNFQLELGWQTPQDGKNRVQERHSSSHLNLVFMISMICLAQMYAYVWLALYNWDVEIQKCVYKRSGIVYLFADRLGTSRPARSKSIYTMEQELP